jgi:pyruvate,orthophosphate dikinase
MARFPDIVDLEEAHDPLRFGSKAVRVGALARAGLPVPPGFVIGTATAAKMAAGPTPGFDAALDRAIAQLEHKRARRLGDPDAPLLLAVRASAGEGASGAPAILNLGLGPASEAGLAHRVGLRGARELRRRLILSFAPAALGVDPEALEQAVHARLGDAADETVLDAETLGALLADLEAIIAEEIGEPFPHDPREQVVRALSAAARAWASPRARMLRAARGDDPEAGMGFIVQCMALGLAPGISGAGVAQARCAKTGRPGLSGRWLPSAQGEDALMGMRHAEPVGLDDAEPGGPEPLEAAAPEIAEALAERLADAERTLRDACQVEFTLEDGALAILDATPLPRAPRAAVAIAVDLVAEGALTPRDALLRVDPHLLIDHLHPTTDPAAPRDVIGRGLSASPGAAAGPVAFTAEAAETTAARGAAPILVRIETSPEDIRGMHVAAGVLTSRGGMTSHAAVVARGLGVPCVVGAAELRIDVEARTLTAPDGRIFHEGDLLTIDGSAGEAMAGTVPMLQPELSGAFATLMGWADEHRRMAIRANADTPADARLAREFGVDGIGLCRTEHMFFEPGRITVMREMILAETPDARRAALERLLPWQRADFVELFTIMRGHPVTIRLLDPPLHEFLPQGPGALRSLAEAMGVPVQKVAQRAADLEEINPMLGKRGCRLGLTVPEIYEMQVRAIFEAAVEAAAITGAPVVPEVMIPLVSANREMDLLRTRIDAVAEAVRAERGAVFDYEVGCMVETPRAALRAGEIARESAFLSFGTNDLTQMTYGLSRDDAGRFMRDYLAQGVLPDDPFHTLDLEGVGELLLIAAERGRRGNPGVTLGLCGEHGGDPASVRFCELAGFDYVSCSPFRVPIARLAAAQATILAEAGKVDALSAAQALGSGLAAGQ